MMTLFCVAFALTFTSCGDDELPEPAAGTKANPYDVTQAINAVKGLTWTSNTVFEETDEVYVKGKISRIVDYGTFHESGTFSNASFYISKDGGTSNESSATASATSIERRTSRARPILRSATGSSSMVD